MPPTSMTVCFLDFRQHFSGRDQWSLPGAGYIAVRPSAAPAHFDFILMYTLVTMAGGVIEVGDRK